MRRQSLKNDAGEPISGIRRLKQEAYGTGKTSGGEAVIDWERWKTPYADEHGFDIRNIEETGTYWIALVLPQDTRIIRYGPESALPRQKEQTTMRFPFRMIEKRWSFISIGSQHSQLRCTVKYKKGSLPLCLTVKGARYNTITPTRICES